MKFLFDNIPIAIVIAGICMLMLYPYIGAGLLLAALCFEAEQYVLMVAAFLICILLQSIMGRRIRPYHVPVKPSRASRRNKKKKKKPSGAIMDEDEARTDEQYESYAIQASDKVKETDAAVMTGDADETDAAIMTGDADENAAAEERDSDGSQE